MKKFILAGALVAAMASQANAQSPTSIAINIERSSLQWTWTQGAPPDDGMVTQFNVKCGRASGSYFTNIPIVDPAARSVPVKQVITGIGQWFCVVTAANEAGESSPTNEVSFLAGTVPVAPINLIVVGK